MMAPQYERARMLCIAINDAASELREPIDRLEVERDHVLVSAGGRRLRFRYYYADSYGADGSPMPGSGRWVVEKITADAESAGPVQRLLSWLRK
jgi:hypothetical protein